MCPITLTIIATTTATMLSTLASGAGIAAAASAAGAAASAAAAGAGFAGAMAAGSLAAASAGLVSGTAVGVAAGSTLGATLATAGVSTTTGAVVGGGTGIAGTGLSMVSVGVELAAFAAIGQGVHSHKEAVKLADDQEESALLTADIEEGDAFNETVRENKELAEEGAIIEIQQARDRGKASNLMNRSDMQVASLLREADREAQSSDAALATKTQNVRSSLRSEHRAIKFRRNQTLGSIKKPSKGSLALGLGTQAVSSISAL